MSITAYFDGACWPNPNGHAGAGAVIKRKGVTVHSEGKYLGRSKTSNNVAEYEGLILVLEYFLANDIKKAKVYGDSMMVIQQITHSWKVKRGRGGLYIPSYDKAIKLADKFTLLEYEWIPREENAEADAMSTKPLRDRGIRNPFEKPEKAKRQEDISIINSDENQYTLPGMEALFKNAR